MCIGTFLQPPFSSPHLAMLQLDLWQPCMWQDALSEVISLHSRERKIIKGWAWWHPHCAAVLEDGSHGGLPVPAGPACNPVHWDLGRAPLLCIHFKSNLAIEPHAEHQPAAGDKGHCHCACSEPSWDRAMLMMQVAACWRCAEWCGQGSQTTAGKIQAEIQLPALFIPRGQVSNRNVLRSSVPI